MRLPADKSRLFAFILERAADEISDFNPSLMRRYYQRFPAARAAFERHSLGNLTKLEAAMIDATLYCVMHWLERPAEVRLILVDQVSHHCETLEIDREWFAGLVEETVALIACTVPSAEPAQQAICAYLAATLCQSLAPVPTRKRRLA